MARTNQKNRSEKRAHAAMLPLLEEKLVRAEKHEGGRHSITWGIVIPLQLVKTYCDSTVSPDIAVPVESRCWAIWKFSREEAVKAYERATESELRPQPHGILTFINLHEWQVELIDEEVWP